MARSPALGRSAVSGRTAATNRLLIRNFAGSLEFNALADYVTIGNSAHVTTDIAAQVTACAWFRPVGNQVNSGAIWLYPTSTLNRGWAVEILSNQKARVSIANGATAQNLDSTNLVKINGWNFIAGVYKQSTILGIYLNGTYTSTAPTINNTRIGTTPLRLGNDNASFGPIGFITECLLLKDSCSQAQLDAYYYNHTIPSIAKAVYYQFTDGSGTTLTDSSGNGVNATITGLDWKTDVPFKSRVAP